MKPNQTKIDNFSSIANLFEVTSAFGKLRLLSLSQCRKGYADILVKSCHTKSLAAMKINEPCKKDVDAICKLLYLISQFHDKN